MPTDASDRSRAYAVHVRFVTRPTRLHATGVEWTEPPLGLGYARGHYEVVGQSADLDGLVRWVLRFGDAVEVLGPDVLRARVARIARRIAERHRTPDAVSSSKGACGPRAL